MSAVLRTKGASFSPKPLDEPALPDLITIERDIYEYPWTLGNFRDSLHAGYACWQVRTGDDALFAYAVVMLAVGDAHLLNLSIARAWQRNGFGARLLMFLMDNARAQGAARMLLEVRPSNIAAQQLYARHGFARIGTRRGYYPATHGREDAIVLARPL